MKRGKWSAGYTIVEVMIVLAVSGLMFIVAANFINGKQPQASFKAGVTEMASRVQDTINQVNDGHYTDIDFKCKDNGSGIRINSGNGNGAKRDCVYIGKLLYFKQGAAKSDYQVVPLVGARLSNGKPPIDFTELQPTAINGGNFSLISDMKVPQNLDISAVVLLDVNDNPTARAYAVGFIQNTSFSAIDTSGGGVRVYKSGAQSLNLVYVSHINATTATIDQDTIDPITNPLVFTDKFAICLTDGSRNATLTVGGTSSKLAVVTKYYGNPAPAICTVLAGTA